MNMYPIKANKNIIHVSSILPCDNLLLKPKEKLVWACNGHTDSIDNI